LHRYLGCAHVIRPELHVGGNIGAQSGRTKVLQLLFIVKNSRYGQFKENIERADGVAELFAEIDRASSLTKVAEPVKPRPAACAASSAFALATS